MIVVPVSFYIDRKMIQEPISGNGGTVTTIARQGQRNTFGKKKSAGLQLLCSGRFKQQGSEGWDELKSSKRL